MTTACTNFLWIALLVSSTSVVAAGWPRAADAQTVRADFNGDGVADLAGGVVGENGGAGGVHIIYGRPATGLDELGNQFFSQASVDIRGATQKGDNCGAALAAGDFNRDGFADLAMGCPGEDSSSGGVNIIYGGVAGLSATAGPGNQFFSQATAGIIGAAQGGDRCGAALAVGDFDGDGRADLAFGCPGEGISGENRAGGVNILYGAPDDGLTADGNQFFSQDTPGIGGGAEVGDRCGAALAAGNFNGDRGNLSRPIDDLAFGCPGEDGTQSDTGVVHVIFGTLQGLSTTDSQVLTRVGPTSQFGSALAVGDFNGDDFADLASGGPGNDSTGVIDTGAVCVNFGSSTGVSNCDSLAGGFLGGSSIGADEVGDRCGATLAAGLFNDDDFADLAIGCIGEDNGAGAVMVLFGSALGVNTGSGRQVLQQGRLLGEDTVGEEAEPEDQFGAALTVGDFDGDGTDDLAIGVPREDVESLNDDAGAVQVIYGTLSGLDATGNQVWTQNSAGIAGGAEAGDLFGFALTGTGGAAGPGLTGVWEGVTQICTGAGERVQCRLQGTFQVLNPGTQRTPNALLQFFLSTDSSLDEGDRLLDEGAIGALQPGETRTRQVNAHLPAGSSATGLFVIALVDAQNVVPENDEENNQVAFGPVE